MPEEVKWDSKARLITVRAWGHGSIEEWQASKRRFLQLHEQFGASRVLIDVREQLSAPSFADLFNFGAEWPSVMRLAIVVSEHTAEEQEFLQLVGENRGKTMRRFLTPDDALQWLDSLEDSSDTDPPSTLHQ